MKKPRKDHPWRHWNSEAFNRLLTKPEESAGVNYHATGCRRPELRINTLALMPKNYRSRVSPQRRSMQPDMRTNKE